MLDLAAQISSRQYVGRQLDGGWIIAEGNISEMKNHSPYIQVDGGVNVENYQKLLECGANVLVAGSAVFASEDPTATILALKQ